MISWLQGQGIDTWRYGQREGVVLACGGVGYDVQLLRKHLVELKSNKDLTLWVHQVQKEDGISLFGFSQKLERDLFRILISVNGIGPQMGMALLEECHPKELVEAIIDVDLGKLTKAQGVGKRTAERLTVELRNKLEGFSETQKTSSTFPQDGIEDLPMNLTTLNELKGALNSLGYDELEIRQALKAVATGSKIGKGPSQAKSSNSGEETDALLKESLLWLSQEAA